MRLRPRCPVAARPTTMTRPRAINMRSAALTCTYDSCVIAHMSCLEHVHCERHSSTRISLVRKVASGPIYCNLNARMTVAGSEEPMPSARITSDVLPLKVMPCSTIVLAALNVTIVDRGSVAPEGLELGT